MSYTDGLGQCHKAKDSIPIRIESLMFKNQSAKIHAKPHSRLSVNGISDSPLN